MRMSSQRTTRGGQITASMAAYDDVRREAGGSGSAGLVLLYAPDYQRLPPAFPLLEGDVTIGREAPAGVLVPQPAVSRSHARLLNDGHGWVIRDLGARNGTLVNGTFVSECRIGHHDDIRVGDAFFKFVTWGAEGYLPYRIDGAVFGGAYAAPSGIIGGWQLANIASSLERIARSAISVVLLGESGTGKEVFARQVHAWSDRKGAFCALNCAAIPPTLLESELFGYRRGAFSGADRDHVGLVRAADGGTLFLDEVGDLPLEAQAKLLRVLQTKEVMPLGATHPEQVDVRIVCATHRDLGAMQTEGKFRGDLFARLNEYSVTLPALRDRKEDVYALCLGFLRLHKRPDLELTVPYLTGLLHYDFPYNVRELEALIKRGIALAEGAQLGAAHLSAEIHERMREYGRRQSAPGEYPSRPQIPAQRPPAPSWAPAPASHAYEPSPLSSTAAADIPPAVLGAYAPAPASSTDPAAVSAPSSASPHFVPSEEELRALLNAHGGNVAAVGRHYGKERMQVHRWMKKYNIDPNDYRSE
jgi:transcriptional regulator with GAF, ATPase, and Fis domain